MWKEDLVAALMILLLIGIVGTCVIAFVPRVEPLPSDLCNKTCAGQRVVECGKERVVCAPLKEEKCRE